MNSKTGNWLLQLVDILAQRGVAGEGSLHGCTEAEIAEVAGDKMLPLQYREFLKTMGRGAGKFFVGTDFFYPSIVDLTDDARELVSEDAAGLEFPNDAIAIAMHQGYELMFLRSDEGENPPVYYYMEGSGEFQRKYNSFSEYLVSAANDDW